jgi:hypothetical protein
MSSGRCLSVLRSLRDVMRRSRQCISKSRPSLASASFGELWMAFCCTWIRYMRPRCLSFPFGGFENNDKFSFLVPRTFLIPLKERRSERSGYATTRVQLRPSGLRSPRDPQRRPKLRPSSTDDVPLATSANERVPAFSKELPRSPFFSFLLVSF